jgi:aminoglycoside 6'-N-acetyltransferase
MPVYDFRPLTKSDLPRIAAWLALPHVARWWPDPERHISWIKAGLQEPWIEPYLIVLAGRPIGYLQCYDPNQEPDGPWRGEPEGTRGLDVFVGEAGVLGRGHGAALLRQFSDGLLTRPEITRIIVDPAMDNHISIRAFAAAGFAKVGERTMPWNKVCVVKTLSASPLDAAIQANLRETTTRVLASLTPREERVLRIRFGIGMNTDHTLEEIGQQYSVTRERIRQIEAKAPCRPCPRRPRPRIQYSHFGVCQTFVSVMGSCVL